MSKLSRKQKKQLQKKRNRDDKNKLPRCKDVTCRQRDGKAQKFRIPRPTDEHSAAGYLCGSPGRLGLTLAVQLSPMASVSMTQIPSNHSHRQRGKEEHVRACVREGRQNRSSCGKCWRGKRTVVNESRNGPSVLLFAQD